MKAKRTKEDHIGYNSGGTIIVATTTSLDDQSNQNYNSNKRELGLKKKNFNFYNGYQNLQFSTT